MNLGEIAAQLTNAPRSACLRLQARGDVVRRQARLSTLTRTVATAIVLCCCVGAALVLRHHPGHVVPTGCAGQAPACPSRSVPSTAVVPGTRRTYTYRWGPIRTGDYATHWVDVKAEHPHLNGFVVGVHARLVDRSNGQPTSIAVAMLHHLYFTRVRKTHHPPACVGSESDAFYSTG